RGMPLRQRIARSSSSDFSRRTDEWQPTFVPARRRAGECQRIGRRTGWYPPTQTTEQRMHTTGRPGTRTLAITIALALAAGCAQPAATQADAAGDAPAAARGGESA